MGLSPGGRHGNLFQCSCLENTMDRGAWWATVHGVAKNQTWPSGSHFHFHFYPLVWVHFHAFLLTSLVVQMVKHLPAMRETWVRSLGREDPLEKGMETLSSVLASKIPWTEEPGGLQSMGSQRVGHNWVTNTHMYIADLQHCVSFWCIAKWASYICIHIYILFHILFHYGLL